MDTEKRENDLTIFHRHVEEFMKRYKPDDDYRADRFYVDLQTLLSRAGDIAQRPFLREIEAYRDLVLSQSLHVACPTIKPPPLG